jgi:DNA-binding Xre family transcriptional regulator
MCSSFSLNDTIAEKDGKIQELIEQAEIKRNEVVKLTSSVQVEFFKSHSNSIK